MKNIQRITEVSLLFCIATSQLCAQNILVSNYAELKEAVNNSFPGDTILMANGTYNINDWAVPIYVANITITSESGNRDSVILNGHGMVGSAGEIGFWVNANNVTISNITIQNVRNHCIQTNTNVDSLHVKNCVLIDAGEQILKVPRGTDISPSEGGIVENCLFEYTAGIGPQYYIGGIDCHFSKDWIIRDNVFKYIKSPESTIAEHAIHFWNDSENTLVEKNLIINCDRGIGFGLGTSGNTGGIIRNNMIYHDSDFGDVGIGLESSPETQVYNNSIFFENDYSNAIEYRFAETQNVYIANNLTNKNITARNGAAGNINNNNTEAVYNWFRDAANGDLHLSSDTLSRVIDQGISIPGLYDDFDGDIRPQGSENDIGADEYYSLTGIESDWNKSKLSKFILYQNYPNPFNPKTVFNYELPITNYVELNIYNLVGQKIVSLVSIKQEAGRHQVEWDASGFASGIYYYQLTAGEFHEVKKMILIK